MGTPRRIRIALFVGLGIVVATLVFFMNVPDENPNLTTSAPRKTTAPVSKGTIVRTIATTGQLEPVQDQTLSFTVAGEVTHVLVEEGQIVEKGDALARIDDTAARLQHLRASSEYETALLSASALMIEERRLELELAELSLEGVVLRAPFDGTVAEVNVNVGDAVGPETRAEDAGIRLVDLNTYMIEVSVDQKDLMFVRTGQDVEVRVDTLPEKTLAGSVTRVGLLPASSDGVVLYPVHVVLRSGDGVRDDHIRLRPGLTAHVDIVTDKVEDVLVVPIAAVVEQGARAWITRIDGDGNEEVVAVDAGISDGLYVEIRSGLSEGDRIVTNNYELYRTLTEESAGFAPGRSSRGRSRLPGRLPLGGIWRR